MKYVQPGYYLALLMELFGSSFWVCPVDRPKRREQFTKLWTTVWRERGWDWDVDEQLEYEGATADYVILWCGLFPAGTVRLTPSWPAAYLPAQKDHGIEEYPFGDEKSFEVNLLAVGRFFRKVARSIVMLKLGRQAVRYARAERCPIGVAAVDDILWKKMLRRYGDLPAWEIGGRTRFEADRSIDIPLAIRIDEMAAFVQRTSKALYWFMFGKSA